VISPLDDVVVVAPEVRYAAQRAPWRCLLEALPGEPRLLERLLGGPAGCCTAWSSWPCQTGVKSRTGQSAPRIDTIVDRR
jgi:hypothetical protein